MNGFPDSDYVIIVPPDQLEYYRKIFRHLVTPQMPTVRDMDIVDKVFSEKPSK